jgi:hypothetical protein
VLQDLIAKLPHGRERRKHVKRLRLNLLAQDTYTKDNASVHLEVHSRIDKISIPCMNPLHLHHAPFSLWIVMAIMRMIGHHLRAASPWLTLVDTSIKATRAKRVVHGRITVSRRELTISHLVACIHCIRCKFSLHERLAPRYGGSKQRP